MEAKLVWIDGDKVKVTKGDLLQEDDLFFIIKTTSSVMNVAKSKVVMLKRYE